MIGGLLGVILYFGIIILIIASMWKIFTKAGKPGWAAIVPIYNIIVMLEIVGRPAWWVVLFLIPFVNVIMAFIVFVDLAKSFGKDVAYALGLIFLGIIFLPMLGFGSATYRGPAASA
ncbi:MAG TPA: DUF5684 domain-containing protein [Verrucomicrobiales bacterium]|nr:signal peptidase I [Verrucomicrobiae bacterium]MCP5553217.1 signal peptidase I [Akkermansiaceae bacterium]HRX56462.1 DUF5684 domain-containing protein [Verrucomicrobiales bacterium]